MTKSTDKSLIEDTEIATADLAEDLIDDEAAELDDDDDDEGVDIEAEADDDVTETGADDKFVERRKPTDRRKVTTRRAAI